MMPRAVFLRYHLRSANEIDLLDSGGFIFDGLGDTL